MRLFHIKLKEISDYSWARNNEKYAEEYKKQIEEADRELADRIVLLTRIGAVLDPELPLVVTSSQMIELTVGKARFEVIRELVSGPDDPLAPHDFMNEFRHLAEKLLAAPALVSDEHRHTAFNKRVEVHMPGQALSTYNELMLAEDSCTDALQRSLDDGWRIIAACPQPDARRPDYVLGRYNPAREIGDSQARRQR